MQLSPAVKDNCHVLSPHVCYTPISLNNFHLRFTLLSKILTLLTARNGTPRKYGLHKTDYPPFSVTFKKQQHNHQNTLRQQSCRINKKHALPSLSKTKGLQKPCDQVSLIECDFTTWLKQQKNMGVRLNIMIDWVWLLLCNQEVLRPNLSPQKPTIRSGFLWITPVTPGKLQDSTSN
jgi:hypothetical protein